MNRDEKLYYIALGVKDLQAFENLLEIIEDDQPAVQNHVESDYLAEYIHEEMRVLKHKKIMNSHEQGQLYALQLVMAEIEKG